MPDPMDEQRMWEPMMPAIRRGDTRREYILGHLLLLSLATGAALVGTALLVLPDPLLASPVGQAPDILARFWALVYAVGGALVVVGVSRLDARYEVAGLLLLALSYGLYAYAISALPEPDLVAITFLLLATTGCTLRAYSLRFEPRSRPWAQRS